ncbi:hypothetical protein Bpfe_004665 [Biomphalaria pfeifferi]|uniref:Uncharacterized protein n=1 Tax=Biomphalaria pfeifferi TaxID=112525 RepID=A0AAD8FJ54_BIOPF|nr:hypothetical protein Bpfe_004665 [Biomphalaria pfeifferi]
MATCGSTSLSWDVHRVGLLKRREGPTALMTTITTSSQERTGQLEKEKATPSENRADVFVGNTPPAVCSSHKPTSACSDHVHYLESVRDEQS